MFSGCRVSATIFLFRKRHVFSKRKGSIVARLKSKTVMTVARTSAFSLLIALGASQSAAMVEQEKSDVPHELAFLNVDLSKQGEEFSRQMDLAIWGIVTRKVEDAPKEAREALDIAQKEWGDDHLYTQMAAAILKLAEANESQLLGGAHLSKASRKIDEARAFVRANREFAGSYHIDILANISQARVYFSFGVNDLAKDHYQKALYAMEQAPGMAGYSEIELEKDRL